MRKIELTFFTTDEKLPLHGEVVIANVRNGSGNIWATMCWRVDDNIWDAFEWERTVSTYDVLEWAPIDVLDDGDA